jgi:hypothetical protein
LTLSSEKASRDFAMVNSDSFDDLEFVLRLPADWLFGLERVD